MIDLSVQNIKKAFQLNKNILDGLSFEVNSGERIGILGKNGAGKTTLFNIITGKLDSDEGDVVIAPGKRTGLISQIPRYPEDYLVEDVLRQAFTRQHEVRDKMTALEQRMDRGDQDQALLKKYGELSALFEHLEGYDMEVNLNKVCQGLDIDTAMRQRVFATLSGGEMTRINLARLLLEKTDILLLDEPTNHLDITGVEWLEEYLCGFRGTVLTVSHDRYFLDKVVTRIVEIREGKATTHSGNYTQFLRWKTQLELEQQRRYEKEQAKIQQLQFTADRMHGWGLQNSKLMRRSQSIEKRIARMSTTAAPLKQRQMHAKFSSAEFRGDEALVIADLKKSYGDKTLFENVKLLVKGGERIGIIGDNGAGKTTLIRMIMGREQPDGGIIRLGPAIKAAYLPQQVHFPDENRTLVDTVIRSLDCSAQTARNRLGTFEFRAEDAFKLVSELSGGEKSRLALCILMEADVNLLILDEPTNHLDVASRNWIEDAVEDYEGALLFVSHDRYFINQFADRIWALENGGITDVEGGYEAYKLLKKKEEPVQKAVRKEQERPQKNKNSKSRKKEMRTRLLALERDIAAHEQQLAQLDEDTCTYATDYEKLTELFVLRQTAQAELDTLMEQWEQLAEEIEREEESN